MISDSTSLYQPRGDGKHSGERNSLFKDFPGGSVGKNPPSIWETLVQSLGQEDPLD